MLKHRGASWKKGSIGRLLLLGEWEERKNEEKKGNNDEHLDEDVALKDGQNKDAASGEEKDGGSSIPT